MALEPTFSAPETTFASSCGLDDELQRPAPKAVDNRSPGLVNCLKRLDQNKFLASELRRSWIEKLTGKLFINDDFYDADVLDIRVPGGKIEFL